MATARNGELCRRRLSRRSPTKHEVEVVRHADEQVKANIELLYPLCKPFEKPLSVCVILEKERLICLPVSDHPTGNVVDRSGVFNPDVSCHLRNMTELLLLVNSILKG